MFVAHACGDLPGAQEGLALVRQGALQAGEQIDSIRWRPCREVRALSAARIPMVVSLAVSTSTSATPALVGLLLCLTGDAHQTAKGLHDEVVAGQVRAPAVPEPGNRGVNQARVPGGKFRIAKPQFVHPAGFEIFHQDVGTGPARAECRSAGSARSRQTDSLLRFTESK